MPPRTDSLMIRFFFFLGFTDVSSIGFYHSILPGRGQMSCFSRCSFHIQEKSYKQDEYPGETINMNSV